MKNGTEWRVLGLWKVWDDLPDLPAPMERPPEALLERIAGVFDHRPNRDEARSAIVAVDVAMRHAFEAREIVGHRVLDDRQWRAILNEGGWMPEGLRRHPAGGRHVRATLAYGDWNRETLWGPATTSGPSIDDVADRLRMIGDSMGLPPVEFGPEVPVFENRRAEPSKQRQGRRRERGIQGL